MLNFQRRMAGVQSLDLISELVKKLSREEMDLVIEHISHRVVKGDFKPGLSTEVTIDMVKDLVESGESRWSTVVVVVDSLNRDELDTFLERVAERIDTEAVQFNHLPETCDSCGECFTSVENLVKHIEKEHEEDVKDCPRCNDRLQGETLSEHMSNVHGVSNQRVVLDTDHQCPVCRENFVSNLAVKRHIKRAHGNEAKVECPECSAMVSDLNTHLKSHQEKKFSCDTCGKKYRTKFDLKTHTNAVHLKVLETCPHCNRQTANLNKHIYGNHTNQFSCNVCEKVFARQTQLNYHMKAHERGTIVERAGPEVQRERKRLANQKYLEKRKARKEVDTELHEHEKNLKRIWARKNRDKLMKYKKEYNEKKRTLKMESGETLGGSQ